MADTNQPKEKGGGRGGGRGRDRKPPSREVTVSKALSLLLRHAAEREGLKIDSQGYANVADVLAWQKLKSLKVTFAEIISAVDTSDKKRFALLYLPPSSNATGETPSSSRTPENKAKAEAEAEAEAGQDENATAKAIASFKTDQKPTHYLIRATQGHSIKSVEAESGLLEKLTLDNPDKLPDTVVHGTYHSTWPLILASGGLRTMGRNHAHFATGPAVQDVLGAIDSSAAKEKEAGSGAGSHGKVISGMRQDAAVLIYLDIRKALAGGCPFWRSENGVILSAGMEVDTPAGSGDGEGAAKGKVIPVEYFDVVIERRKGMGKIWERGEVLQTLPEELTRKGNPKRRGGGK
ncbi:KptA family-domain-containing protein [Aspergillus multicolor]|uniref:tRNA 2'-phosphotransferase n=1 Tax=Aspergillus multicolor TaxID=41759 RepID=UPI003CCE45E9